MLVTGCRVTRLHLVEGDLARLEGRPEETLVPPSSKGRHGQSSNQLHAVLLTLCQDAIRQCQKIATFRLSVFFTLLLSLYSDSQSACPSTLSTPRYSDSLSLCPFKHALPMHYFNAQHTGGTHQKAVVCVGGGHCSSVGGEGAEGR